MPDNPQTAAGLEFALPDHRILALEGRDAVAFAQAQFMNEVAGLPAGEWQWNGWLTPKGRVIALFALLKVDAQTLWLLLPDADPGELAGQLQRFVFRSKLVLRARDDLQARGAFAAPAQAAGARIAGNADTALELDVGGDGGPRTLRIVATAAAGEPLADAAALLRWRDADLQHGLPRLPPGQVEQWTPQQLSLERLRAFSVKKGCYPGQEIVARTHFLGQAKRGLALFEVDGAVAPGSEVRDGERVLGSIVCTSDRHALALLPLERAPLERAPLERASQALHADGVELRERPLLGGLAR